MTVALSIPRARFRLADLVRVVRTPSARFRRRNAATDFETALVRALCHDMGGSVSILQATLGRLGEDRATGAELLGLAQAQATHLASLLRTVHGSTATATGSGDRRPLAEVVATSAAASGLPRALLEVELRPGAGDVRVPATGCRRILGNLLENAHRHGDGASVRLTATRRTGRLELVLIQTTEGAARVLRHLNAATPPPDLTGLGLWSVRRQTQELGGHVVGETDGDVLTLRILLPDR
jgi:signal transduction histidine kinase